MTLRQATELRLADMRYVFAEAGITEHTGKLRYHEGTRQVSGRIGGVKSHFPELKHFKQSPKVIAAAIQRRKGKIFRQVRAAIEQEMLKHGYAPPRTSGKKTVPPHKGKRYCIHCRELHTKGEHRFHGKGSFHQTHLFSFNPKMAKRNMEEWKIPAGWEKEYERYDRWKTDDLKREYLELTKASFDRVFGGNAKKARMIVGRILRERGYYWIENELGDIPIRENRPNPPNEPAILYSDIGTISNAHKGQSHICDLECAEHDHRYIHEFKRGKPVMIGLSPGQMITIPEGVYPILLWPQKDFAKLRVVKRR